MLNRHPLRLFLLWVLLSMLLALFLFSVSQSAVKGVVQDRVRQHLILTLDESHFGDARDRISDQRALQRIGEKINVDMQNLIIDRWFSAQKNCAVRLQRVDDVLIDSALMHSKLSFSLPRNQIEREVLVGLSCSTNWGLAVGISCLLGLLFLAISILLPPPLSEVQRDWIAYLRERGYGDAAAFEIIHSYGTARLSLSPTQLACLEQLHDSKECNFSWVLEAVTDARVAALNKTEVEWLLLGLRNDPGSLDGALNLASVEDSVVIQLNEMKLSVHGMPVPMSRTHLLYYAWYAMSRVEADGWITNPASNRPDKVVGQELGQLMSRYDGHARAIKDLEQTGLKARTLDQNRSKIKEDLVAVLGESLAGKYLFEASKHSDGVRMRYRLRLESGQIRILS